MAKLYSEYLHDNEDFLNFLDKTSENTGKRNMPAWLKNLNENREIFKPEDWACTRLQDVERGKTAIIIGASPALQNQVETLRNIQNDKDFVLCGISSNLEFLLKNGIYPKYVITVDSDPSQGEFWDNLDMAWTKNIVLIANIYAYPGMLRKWKGPLYWLAFGHTEGKLARKQNKWYGPINGTGQGFPALMSQLNIMAAFAFSCLGCPILLFVGNEFSFKTKETSLYVDRADERDKDYRGQFLDIYGKIVYTNYGLLVLKIALEAFLGAIAGAGWFINCSEDGIFGVTKRFPGNRVPWIHQMTLKNGIAQARQIMRTGEPFYESAEGKSIIVPRTHEHFTLDRFARIGG